MIRFILFIFGICLGMAAAIAALPLPGKTFFNRMSKLPNGIRSLIDNGIDLAISVTQLISSVVRELAMRTNQTALDTKDKFGQIKDSLNRSRTEFSEKIKESSNSSQDSSQQDRKEAKI